jgi:hypothetical protein
MGLKQLKWGIFVEIKNTFASEKISFPSNGEIKWSEKFKHIVVLNC